MNQFLKWLSDGTNTPWHALADAAQRGLPVPDGFIVVHDTPQDNVRLAYEELKLRTKTHFLAVRAPSHAVLNVLEPDPLIHTLRRLWGESRDVPVLVQCMIHSMWCGKAIRNDGVLAIKANEGMLILDPDTYYLETGSGKWNRSVIEPRQRKVIRHVDGTTRTVERQDEHTPMTEDQLRCVAVLAERAQGDITWALDDQDRVWLISMGPCRSGEAEPKAE